MQKAAKYLLSFTGFVKNHKIAVIFALVGVCFMAANSANAQAPGLTFDQLKEMDPGAMLLLLLAWVLQAISWAVGKFIVLIIGMIVVPILGYNNFGDSNIVDIGWPLVRDVVNMFVIVILLVIAIQTMLGINKTPLGQQLPRLFIAVVALNFSRMLTLLIIDLGQVVMFTFVNALRDIAAGNFVNLFQITGFMALDGENLVAASSQGGLVALGYLGTSYVTLSLMLMVLGVLLLMAVIFIYRIAMLWVLLILSPIAFFLAATKSVLNTGEARYKEWWGKLIGSVTLGPILTFFLWLGLAAASSGPISTSEEFPAIPPSDAIGLYSEIFQMDKLTSLFIGITLMSIGFQAASGAAQSMGGVAAQYITKEKGQAGMKMALGAPAAVGARIGRRGGVELERRTGAFSGWGRGMTEMGGGLRAGGGLVGGAAGWAMAKVGGRVESMATASTQAQKQAAKKEVDSMTAGEAVATMRSTDPRARRGLALSQAEMDRVEEVNKKYATDKNFRRQADDAIRSQMGEEAGNAEIGRRRRDAMQYMRRGDVDLTPDQRKARDKFEVGNLEHLRSQYTNDDGTFRSADDQADFRERLEELIVDSEDFNKRDLSADGVRIPEVQEMLGRRVEREYTDRDGNIVQRTALDEARAGRGVDSGVHRALQGEGTRFGAAVTVVPGNPIATAQSVEAAAGTIEAAMSNTNPETTNPARLAAAQAEEREAANAREAAARAAGHAAPATQRDEYNIQAGDRYLEARNIDPALHMTTPEQTTALVLGAARSGADVSEIPAAARGAFVTEALDIASDATRSAEDQRAARRVAFSATPPTPPAAGGPPGHANGAKLAHIGISVSGTIGGGMQATVREEFTQRPENLAHLDDQFTHTPTSTDATRTVVENVGQAQLDRIVRQHNESTNAAVRAQMQQAVHAVQEAIRAEIMALGPGARVPGNLTSAQNRANLAARNIS
ncbi:MAG: hypothetical protein ABH846_00350 [Patescibacteria group bacterium]